MQSVTTMNRKPIMLMIDNVEHQLSIEFTPRGGHLINIVALTWSGLYRFDTALSLFASCHGSPPVAIEVSSTLSRELTRLLNHHD